jgi:hypothetical protein
LSDDVLTKPDEVAKHRSIPARFKVLIDAAVSKTIADLLGRDASQSFFKYLSEEQGIPTDMVAQRLDVLFFTLDRAFGIGGRTVGKAIIRNLYTTLGLKFSENSNNNLSDYMEEALFEYVREIIKLSQ